MTDRVLIIGDDIGIFLAVARSLGRRGVEVHVAPSDLSSPGLASRYIGAVHILPPYHADPPAWVDALQSLIADNHYALILPCSDSSLVILAHHAERLGRARLALPNSRAMAVFTGKAETRSMAVGLGIPVAKACTIDAGTTAADLAERLGLPLVLKPRASYILGDYETKRSARIVRDDAALEQALAAVPGQGWIAEAFFRGAGVGLSVLARDGRILLAWQHRRLRAVSETGASTVRVGEIPEARLLAHVEALVAATALDGVAMFEFRCDPASGAHILLEVNPRFWGSLPLAVAAGADFPAALWDMLTGGACAPGPVPRIAIIKRNMTGEFNRLVGEIEASTLATGKLLCGLSMVRLLFSMPFAARFDSWAGDDREPFRVERRQLRQRLVRAVAKRLQKPVHA